MRNDPPKHSSNKRRRRNRPRHDWQHGPHGPPLFQHTERKNWMSSLPPWLVLVVALASTFISSGYTWATMEAKIERNREELSRIERESRAMESRAQESFRQINTTIANLGQLRTDVEVMKNSLASITEVLRRLERRLDYPGSNTTIPSNNSTTYSIKP